MELPFPLNGRLVFRGVEEALCEDVLNYQLSFVKKGAHANSPLFSLVNKIQLEQYSKTFEKVLRNTHPRVKFGESYDLENAVCLSFVFGDKASATFGSPTDLEDHLDCLLAKQKSPTLRVQRVVRVFDGNCLFFVKPKAFRFWTRSIAVRDADEVFASLQEQGM